MLANLVASCILVCSSSHHHERVRQEVLEQIANGMVTVKVIYRDQSVHPTRILEGDKIRFLGGLYYIDATITRVIDCGYYPQKAEWLIEFQVDP